VDEKPVFVLASHPFPKPMQRPFCRGMVRHLVMQNPTAPHFQGDHHILRWETRGHRHRKIARYNRLSVIAEEPCPRLRTGLRPMLRSILERPECARGPRGETSIPSFNHNSAAIRSSAQVGFSFTVRTISRRIFVGSRGLPFSISNLEQFESLAMPPDQSLRLEDAQCFSPVEPLRPKDQRKSRRLGQRFRVVALNCHCGSAARPP
jgi:hypothetical protein